MRIGKIHLDHLLIAFVLSDDILQEFVDMANGCANTLVKQVGDGGFFKLGYEGHSRVGRAVSDKFEIEAEDLEI